MLVSYCVSANSDCVFPFLLHYFKSIYLQLNAYAYILHLLKRLCGVYIVNILELVLVCYYSYPICIHNITSHYTYMFTNVSL